ncbi:MAG: hypothetical protein WCK39_08835, partial [Methanomassiliicoccales archaeon]
EGGFLPAPVVIKNQPVNYNTNPANFDVGNVNQFALCLGPAERADVIVDFSQFAGKTIILYNDAPAPFPAIDPRQDYYTGHPDLTDQGGSPTTIVGYGSNTRTIMQIRVANATPAAAFNTAALYDAFNTTSTHTGVFAADQDNIIVPESSYNSAYNTSYIDNWVQIQAKTITFTPIGATSPLTMSFEEKALHDEMGAAFDQEYGRMAVMIGLEQPNPTSLTSNVILFNFPDPPTEVIASSQALTPIGTLSDGTQIWKFSHNGVDSHVMHWHLFNVQLINRVAWDNNVRFPEANELGWKETLRVDPLQDTIFALRPIVPTLPFDIPDSIRPLDVTKPLGALLKLMSFDPLGTAITVNNHMVNFGWEYIWHCHMLAHEEMDAMRSMVIGTVPRNPTNLTGVYSSGVLKLNWTDNSMSETGFTIERALDAAFKTRITRFNVGANVELFNDTTIRPRTQYYYRVFADNLVGDTFNYQGVNPQAVNFPTINMVSGFTNAATPAMPPLGTARFLTAAQSATGAPVVLTWSYLPSGDQTSFVIQRATDAAFTVYSTMVNYTISDPALRTYSDAWDTMISGTKYFYRVEAANAVGNGPWSNTLSVVLDTRPPTGVTALTSVTQAVPLRSPVVLSWSYSGSDQTGFVIQRATNAAFTAGLRVINVGNVLTYSDPVAGLRPGTTYYYRVVATNLAGNGATWSSSMNILVHR